MSRSSSKMRAMPLGASGAYTDMMGILQQYVSGILAESTVGQSLVAHGRSPSTFGPRDVDVVIEHAMIGLRMFCDPTRLPDLMIALAEYCAAQHAQSQR